MLINKIIKCAAPQVFIAVISIINNPVMAQTQDTKFPITEQQKTDNTQVSSEGKTKSKATKARSSPTKNHPEKIDSAKCNTDCNHLCLDKGESLPAMIGSHGGMMFLLPNGTWCHLATSKK